MYYYLKTDNKDFVRQEWQELDESIKTDWSNIEELYLGDVIFRAEDPTSYIQQVFHKIPANSVLYIEGYDFYAVAGDIVYGSKSLQNLSDMIIKYGYKRIVDINYCRDLLEKTGFQITYEDVDASKFVISFYKPDLDGAQ